MPIEQNHLPIDLHYIIPLAERHGSDARTSSYDRRRGRHVDYAETLTKGAIEPLRKLYAEISAKGHGSAINRWYHSLNRKVPYPTETAWSVYGLLVLFAQLGRLGVAPFDDGAVSPQDPEETEPLDWSKLPASLKYLAGPAERFGRLHFGDPIHEFLQERMSPDERSELRALSRRCARDEKSIERWLDEFRMTEHPEARLVYFTGVLLVTGEDLGLL